LWLFCLSCLFLFLLFKLSELAACLHLLARSIDEYNDLCLACFSRSRGVGEAPRSSTSNLYYNLGFEGGFG
jgi:hypothetical protein